MGILPSVLFTLQSKVAGHERDGRDDPGIVPDLCDGSGSARCLEADAQEDFLEGFSLRGADHS